MHGSLFYAFRKDDFRMGTGNYGTAFEAVIRKSDEMDSLRGDLTPEQKRRRVVLKRVNVDNEGIRSNFLRVGTVARGAAETGQVESYMYSKVSRNLFVKPYCADFKGVFFAGPTGHQALNKGCLFVDRSVGSITAGSQYLVWNFETDSTLADAIEGRLGAFPESIAYLFVSNSDSLDQDERDYRTVQQLLGKIATGVKQLHSIGIVHRDVKPENLLLTSKGDIKIIDFGAAADMSTNINFNPLVGMLDPRYSPPEELIVPQSMELFLVSLGGCRFSEGTVSLDGCISGSSHMATGSTRSLRCFQVSIYSNFKSCGFDSLGMILMQMSVPQLRSPSAMVTFASELGTYAHDLDRWREQSSRAQSCDFRLLDMRNGAGWELAKKLIRRRNGLLRLITMTARLMSCSFLRGRMSIDDALGQRFFS